MANIEDKWNALLEKIKSSNLLEKDEMDNLSNDMYYGSYIYENLLAANSDLAKEALEVLSEHMVESEMLYNFPEYAPIMLKANADVDLAYLSTQAAEIAMGDEDCDVIRDIVNFLRDDLKNDSLAEDTKQNAIANCCPEDEYDWG